MLKLVRMYAILIMKWDNSDMTNAYFCKRRKAGRLERFFDIPYNGLPGEDKLALREAAKTYGLVQKSKVLGEPAYRLTGDEFEPFKGRFEVIGRDDDTGDAVDYDPDDAVLTALLTDFIKKTK